MSFFSGKKLLLVGFVIVLLVAIPVTVYLVQQQQRTKSSAEAATTLSLVQTPQNAKVGDSVSFDVVADPSEINQIGFIKLVLTYDPTKLATTPASFVPTQWPSADGSTFTPSIPIGPEYGNGTITVAMSVGGSLQNVLQHKTTIAKVTFTAIDTTDVGVPTQVTFGSQTQVLSAGGINGTDEGGISVLSVPNPGQVNITEGGDITETPPPTDTPTPTDILVTDTVTQTPTPTDTTDTVPTDSVTPTETPSPTGAATLTCTNLTVDPGTGGTAPFAVNITAVGTSTDAAINKVSFNFGDGQTQDVTDSGGIGTSSISVLTSHTYATSGTFNATATITDINGAVSSGGCTATIAVTNQAEASPTTLAASPSPLPPTGPTGLITIGAIGVFLTFIGAILLLAL